MTAPARRARDRVAALCLLLAALAAASCRGQSHGPGTIRGKAVPAAAIAERRSVQRDAARALSRDDDTPSGEILFGDLHVHSTWSSDAYMMSLPLMQGEGVHPVADACDFARYCSQLDFWGITDHAETLTPKRWRETIDSVRACEAVGAGSEAPDLLTFLGWEWTQIGLTADQHYGHRNVVLRHLDEGRIPLRPVAAAGFSGQVMRDKLPFAVRFLLPEADWKFRGRYLDFIEYWRETRDAEECPQGVPVRDVARDCMDFANTPAELFDRIRQWNVEATVIPHGTSWGMYTPPGYYIDRSLRGEQHDDELQRLVEIDSGHGNVEPYRSWREATVDPDGHLVCPEPTPDYEPCCWRAGEILRARCEDPSSADCESRVEEARRNYLAAGASGRLTISGADIPAWGACGQCLDCFDPVFEHRPGGSAQYALALTDFTDPDELRRFHFGFIGSSDDHTARPGTGYKEFARQQMTESFGPRSEFWHERIRPVGPLAGDSEAIDPTYNRFQRFQILDFERGSSFFYTGGLVAVHAARRDRDSVWEALQRREVYATSGERILLWFDLLRGAARPAAMGSEVVWAGAPRFRVRAAGSFEQKPGCPDWAREGLGDTRLDELCVGECYNPSDTRRRITRIEVVRIFPQMRPGEPIAALVRDPWKVIPCSGDREGCVAEFTDHEFASGGRDAIYYVRAIQEPTPAVNAAGLRCRPGDKGPCTSVEPCYGDWRTDYDDDCLAPSEERAWSSPIYLTFAHGGARDTDSGTATAR